MLTPIVQSSLLPIYLYEYFHFICRAHSLEQVQLGKLNAIFKNLQGGWSLSDKINSSLPKPSYAEFIKKFPVTDYSDWQSQIERARDPFLNKNNFSKSTSPIVRFEPTSGSTECVKWIPYTDTFLNEINRAAQVWIMDSILRDPQILLGKHYWSLSWVPKEMRCQSESLSGVNSDDVELFPSWQRKILSQIMAVPSSVQRAESRQASWFATLCYLVEQRDLAILSVWSPTFLLQLVNDLCVYQGEIVNTLTEGRWRKFQAELKFLKCPKNREQAQRLREYLKIIGDAQGNERLLIDHVLVDSRSALLKSLWPRLRLISAWESSTSFEWAQKVKALFPSVHFQGKGLWATEGVVTIPFRGKRVLSYQSHFYEFRSLNSGQVIPSWELKAGMEVQPIITTSGGLIRYQIYDRLRVEGFYKKIPQMEFLGRLKGVDLVGEKLDYALAESLLSEIQKQFNVNAICFVAHKEVSKPYYQLLIEGKSSPEICQFTESKLLTHYHYRLARELHQLGPLEVKEVTDIFTILPSLQRSYLVGQNKMEPIMEMNF